MVVKPPLLAKTVGTGSGESDWFVDGLEQHG